MIPVAVQKDRDLWERAFNLAPRVFSFSKMSAAILKKREDSGARSVNARLACERQTYFRSSLLSRFFLDRKYVCGSQESQAMARVGVAKNPVLVSRASILLVSVVDR